MMNLEEIMELPNSFDEAVKFLEESEIDVKEVPDKKLVKVSILLSIMEQMTPLVRKVFGDLVGRNFLDPDELYDYLKRTVKTEGKEIELIKFSFIGIIEKLKNAEKKG